MGFFKSLGKALVNTVTLPANVVRDVTSFDGDTFLGKTERNLDRLGRNVRRIEKSLDEED